MAEFDFASPQRREKQDDPTVAFAPSVPNKQDNGAKPKTGMQALKDDPQLRAAGADPHQGLMAMATLVGMARHILPHVDAVDAPTGLMSLLKNPVHNQLPTSDGQKYSLDLNKDAEPGGQLNSKPTAVGAPGGVAQDAAKGDSRNQAMQAVGNLTSAMGNGMATTLANAGDIVQRQLTWLSQGAKELYKIRR